jgi:hypothetical protein
MNQSQAGGEFHQRRPARALANYEVSGWNTSETFETYVDDGDGLKCGSAHQDRREEVTNLGNIHLRN